MINFRYHVVSLIGVLAALGIGLVLGSGLLSSGTGTAAAVQVVDLQAEAALLRERVATSESSLTFADSFGEQTQAAQVADTLTDRSIVIVALPGAAEQTVAGTEQALVAAGASVTGTVSVLAEWTDAPSDALLDSLAAQLVTSGTSLPDTDGYERGAVVLASAVLEPTGSDEKDADVLTATPAAYEQAGVIDVPDPLSGTAELAVLVAGPPVEDDGQAGRRIRALSDLVAAVDAAGSGSVVAGPPVSAGPLGAVDAVRTDADLAALVSTVDMAHLSSGRTATVFALVEQADGGVGHYGAVGQVDGPLPATG